MLTRSLSANLMILLLSLAFSQAALAENKVVVLYSSVGQADLQVAQALSQSVHDKAPTVKVGLKDINDFTPPNFLGRLRTRLYTLIAQNSPALYRKLYSQALRDTQYSMNISQTLSPYDRQALAAYIRQENPTSVLVTNFIGARDLLSVREQGSLFNVPVGWLNLEPIDEVKARVAQGLDLVFTPQAPTDNALRRYGLGGEKVVAKAQSNEKIKFFDERGLDLNKKTIFLDAGQDREGRNLKRLVDKILKDAAVPIQIVVSCEPGKNNYFKMAKLEKQLASSAGNKVFVADRRQINEVRQYVQFSDLIVNKASAWPINENAILKPVIVVEDGKNQEAITAAQQLSIIKVAKDDESLATTIDELIKDPSAINDLKANQSAFLNSTAIESAAHFALSPRMTAAAPAFDLGVEDGTSATVTEQQIQNLDQDSPADVEVLLAYGKFMTSMFSTKDNNVWGHIAVRIGDKVYTMNSEAKRNVDKNLIVEIPLQEYLYAVKRPRINGELPTGSHTDIFGELYARNNIGLRIKGVTKETAIKMLDKVAWFNEQWNLGELDYNEFRLGKGYNCADFVDEVLQAGDLNVFEAGFKSPGVTLPIDVFSRAISALQKRNEMRAELVGYTRVPNSKNKFLGALTRFPLSLFKVVSLVHAFFPSVLDRIETAVTKRLAFYPGSNDAVYENLDGGSFIEQNKAIEKAQVELNLRYQTLKTTEKSLEDEYRNISESHEPLDSLKDQLEQIMTRLSVQERRLVERGDYSTLNDLTRQKITKLVRALRSIDEDNLAYQSKLDVFNKAQFDFLADTGKLYVEKAEQAAHYNLLPKDAQNLTLLSDKVTAAYRIIQENRRYYGEPKDSPTRQKTYIEFWAAVNAFSKRWTKITSTVAVTLNTTGKTHSPISSTFINLGRRIRGLVNVVTGVGGVARDLIFLDSADEGAGRAQKAVNRLARGAGDLLGFKVIIEGQEVLEQLPKDKNVVNIFVPTHRHYLHDLFIMGGLNIDDYFLFAASDQFLPPLIGDRVDKINWFMNVGRGSDKPTNKALEQVMAQSNGQARNIVIYPEGSVNAGLGETRAPRPKFSSSLVRHLKDEGYSVNIIPVTYLDASVKVGTEQPLFAKKNQDGQVVLHARVGRPIPPAMVDMIMKTSGDLALNRFIRASWLENMSTNASQLHGQLKIDQTLEHLNSGLKVISSFAHNCQERFGAL